MDMNFPHPRRATEAGAQPAEYSALIASAIARQASSHTVSALLTAQRGRVGEIDALDSRMAFFAYPTDKQALHARGAFLPAKFESAVNLADSNNVKFNQSQTVKPEYQAAARGTEL
jgi:hypothetical protein